MRPNPLGYLVSWLVPSARYQLQHGAEPLHLERHRRKRLVHPPHVDYQSKTCLVLGRQPDRAHRQKLPFSHLDRGTQDEEFSADDLEGVVLLLRTSLKLHVRPDLHRLELDVRLVLDGVALGQGLVEPTNF